MSVLETRTGLDVLDRDECLRLVATRRVGRIAIVDGGRPLVFPVNFALDGEDVVFRTGSGMKLAAGPREPVCFQVDEIDDATRSGWSVIVSGRLEEVTAHDARTLARIRALDVDPWATVPKDHWMRVVARTVTGRRIPRP